MWLYRCIFILFPCIVNCMKDNEQIKLQTGDQELIFTDVIKNISRVNNVLQELINNYEQLKKLYKSQENSRSVESDTEIDEVFKAKEKRKYRKRTTKKAQPSGEFPATQMFWSDGEEISNSASVGNEKNQNYTENTPAKDTTEKAGDNSRSDQSIAESTDTSGENQHDNIKTKKTKPTLKQQSEIVLTDIQNEHNNYKTKKSKPALRQQPEIIFIDTRKTTKNLPKTKPNIMKTIPRTINKIIDAKTIIEDQITNDTSNVQKVVRAELFSKNNIWNEILKNKPIQLKKSDINYDSTRKPGDGTKQGYLKSKGKNKMPSAIQDTNNNKNIKNNPEKNNDGSFDQTEYEVVIKREQFKTDVLRTAYGDACLKLVVTKCIKACTAAEKSVCHRHKCKDNFKHKYKAFSRKSCRKEFWGDNIVVDEEAGSHKQMFRGVTDDKKQQTTDATENSNFADLTRGGYLSVACLPPGHDVVGPNKNASFNVTKDSSKNPGITLNILRDRYESACKKISAGKCMKACSFAYNTACKDTCNREKKKAFKKACRNECKSAYKLEVNDSSGSDEYYEYDESEPDTNSDDDAS